MKKLVSLILTGAMVFSLVACGNANNNAEVGSTSNQTAQAGAEAQTQETLVAETRHVVDHVGAEVDVPAQIDRVVVGNVLPLASVLSVYLGGAEKIVGLHPASMGAAQSGLLSEIYPEILEAETDFINGQEVNMEELLNLDPDVVIGVTEEQAKKIREAGIPAVSVSTSKWDYDVLETYNQWIDLFDQIFGESEVSDQVSAYSQEVYDSILEKVSTIPDEEKKRVMILFGYDDESMTVSGPQFFGQFWCDASGALNVADGATIEKGSLAVTMEQVYEWNPDIIVITNFTSAQPEDLYSNAIGGDDWSTVKAVQEGQVYKMPLALYRTFTPGADTPVTLQWFAKTVYPELFADVDINEVTKNYFKDFFNIELTDEQVANMYAPSRDSANGL